MPGPSCFGQAAVKPNRAHRHGPLTPTPAGPLCKSRICKTLLDPHGTATGAPPEHYLGNTIQAPIVQPMSSLKRFPEHLTTNPLLDAVPAHEILLPSQWTRLAQPGAALNLCPGSAPGLPLIGRQSLAPAPRLRGGAESRPGAQLAGRARVLGYDIAATVLLVAQQVINPLAVPATFQDTIIMSIFKTVHRAHLLALCSHTCRRIWLATRRRRQACSLQHTDWLKC